MITTFEVGSVFKIVDQGSATIRSLAKATAELDGVVSAARKNMTGLSRTKLTGITGQFKGLTTEVGTFNRAILQVAASISKMSRAGEALVGVGTQVTDASASVALLGREWGVVAKSAGDAAGAMRAAGRVRSPSAVALPAATDAAIAKANLLTDAWRETKAQISTAVAEVRLLARETLPATPGGSRRGGGSGLSPIPGTPSLPGAGRGGRHGPRQGWHLGRFGTSIPVAGGHVHASTMSSGPGVAVGAGLFSVYELMKHAEEPMHQEAALRLLNIEDPTIRKMAQEARDIAINVPGSGYSHNLKTMGELYSIVGADGAIEIAPKLAEIDRVQSMVGGAGKDQGSAYVLTRATELMGALTNPYTHKVDMKAFGGVIDNMSKMSIASHGKVTPEEWLNYAKQAGPAAGNLSMDGLYTTYAIIQAMGGNRAGTAAAAIQRQFAGGVMTESKAKALEEIGIFKPGDYETGKGGHILVKNNAAKSFVDKLQKDPLDAVISDLIPALETHGFSANEDMTKELYRIIGTAPAQREIYEIIRGREQIQQERARAKGALAPGAALDTLNSNDPEMVTSSFTVALKDLMGAVGGPMMQSAIPGIRGLTTAFNEMSASASRHPTETSVIGSGLAGAATGATIGFGLGLLPAPVAPFTAPAGALGGALIGGALGSAYAYMASTPQPKQTAYDRRQERLKRNGLLPDQDPNIGGTSWNVVPPPQKVEIQPQKVSLNVDGRTWAEVVMSWIARDGNGAAQGSPYPDTTRGGSSFDLALLP